MRLVPIASLLLAALPAPAVAQSTESVEQRIGRIERQLRAVQRTVFPNGEPVAPETGIAAPAPAGVPATSPSADAAARLDAIERSLAALTGQVETTANRVRLLEEAARAGQPGAAPAATTPSAASSGGEVVAAPAPAEHRAAELTTAARAQAVAAVEVPVTGDAIEDAYSYGYRLYVARLYPEAQTVLKEFVAKHPRHRRASYAQNLLGRAYLDEGKPALASVAFYDNYQKYPKGERAAESLTWLGQSLTQLGKKTDACKVYGELDAVFGRNLAPELRERATRGRTDAGCPA